MYEKPEILAVRKRLAAVWRFAFTKHCENKMAKRGLSKEALINALKDPGLLISAESQADHYKEGEMFLLIFQKSRKYELAIVAKFIGKQDIKVITAHIQSRKRKKLVEKWGKKL